FGPAANLGPITIGGYTIQDVTAATQGALVAPDVLDTNTLVTNAAPGTTDVLHIFVTGQNVAIDPSVSPQPVLSSFDNVGLMLGWSVIEQTYVDPNNAILFGETLAFVQFNTPEAATHVPNVFLTEGSSLASFTAQYSIGPNGIGGQSNLGISISDVSAVSVRSVPGPVVGAGIPGLLGMLGFGGFGWWRRRRKIA